MTLGNRRWWWSINTHGFHKTSSIGAITSFSNNCSSLTGWTNTGWTVTTTSGQTCFSGNGAANFVCDINTGLTSFKGKTISFNLYLTGGCPEFVFACNSSGNGGSTCRWEQRYSTQSGISINSNNWFLGSAGQQTYTWGQNVWKAFSIQITSGGVATIYVDGVNTGLTCPNITENGGYIGFNSDGGGGYVSINNITIS